MDSPTRPHPEFVAAQRKLIAERKRFVVSLQRPIAWGERLPEPLFEGGATPLFDAAIRDALLPAIRRASSCEIRGSLDYRDPWIEEQADTARRDEWIERYLRRDKRNWAVDLRTAGIWDDLRFWRWLIRGNITTVWSVERSHLDDRTLWRLAWAPLEGNHTVDKAVAKRARDTLGSRDVALTTTVDGTGFTVGLMAQEKTIVELFEAAVEACPWDEEIRAALAPDIFVHDKERGLEASIAVAHARDPEATLESFLKKGINRPADDRALEFGLAAAELVAAACGRRSERRGKYHESEEEAIERVRSFGTLNDATLALALELAGEKRIRRAQEARWLAPESKAEVGEIFDDLLKRLEACRTERRVRASSPNAKPLPPAPAEDALWPESLKAIELYAAGDDLVDFLDALAARTGARYFRRHEESGVELVEVRTGWELQELLQEENGNGVLWGHFRALYIAWPEVAPPTLIHRDTEDTSRDRVSGADVSRTHRTFVPGWGCARLVLGGPKRGDDRCLIWSVLEYPTGSEVRGPRFRRPGPWATVDWAALRTAIRATRALLRAQAVAHVERGEPTLILPRAAAAARDGVRLGGKAGYDRHVATPGLPRK